MIEDKDYWKALKKRNLSYNNLSYFSDSYSYSDYNHLRTISLKNLVLLEKRFTATKDVNIVRDNLLNAEWCFLNPSHYTFSESYSKVSFMNHGYKSKNQKKIINVREKLLPESNNKAVSLWRLPSIFELATMISNKGYEVSHPIRTRLYGVHWSQNCDLYKKEKVWSINISDGFINKVDINYEFRLKLILFREIS